MGILNLTPDSFSDGGKFDGPESAISRFRQLIEDGADIIDIGAESSFGPEAQVTAEEEWGRLEPVLVSLRGRDDRGNLLMIPMISIDTWKSDVAEKALQMGARMINDVTALRGDSRMVEVMVEYKPFICLMYSAHETPYAQKTVIQYPDVIETIRQFLLKQTNLLIDRGFPKEKIIIDPGLGYFISSDPKYSWEIIDRLEELQSLGFPILISPSMKSFLGGPIEARLQKTLGASEMCLAHGANILRVHHVREHKVLLDEVV